VYPVDPRNGNTGVDRTIVVAEAIATADEERLRVFEPRARHGV